MALVDNEVAPEFSFQTPYQRSPKKNLGGENCIGTSLDPAWSWSTPIRPGSFLPLPSLVAYQKLSRWRFDLLESRNHGRQSGKLHACGSYGSTRSIRQWRAVFPPSRLDGVSPMTTLLQNHFPLLGYATEPWFSRRRRRFSLPPQVFHFWLDPFSSFSDRASHSIRDLRILVRHLCTN